MPRIDPHEWQKGDLVRHEWLNELRDALMSVLTGGKGIIVKSFGKKVVVENTVTWPIPDTRGARGATTFKLTGGPDGSNLYTARKQLITDHNTFADHADTADYKIYFVDLTGELPGAESGERWNNKKVRATYHGTNSSDVQIWHVHFLADGVFNLTTDST